MHSMHTQTTTPSLVLFLQGGQDLGVCSAALSGLARVGIDVVAWFHRKPVVLPDRYAAVQRVVTNMFPSIVIGDVVSPAVIYAAIGSLIWGLAVMLLVVSVGGVLWWELLGPSLGGVRVKRRAPADAASTAAVPTAAAAAQTAGAANTSRGGGGISSSTNASPSGSR